MIRIKDTQVETPSILDLIRSGYQKISVKEEVWGSRTTAKNYNCNGLLSTTFALPSN